MKMEKEAKYHEALLQEKFVFLLLIVRNSKTFRNALRKIKPIPSFKSRQRACCLSGGLTSWAKNDYC